jgi:protein involved in polysaccharide export with SLBB domain
VTRRADKGPIPLPNAVENPADQSSSVEINLDSLTTNLNPAENLVLLASDVVNVERAERIFASGEVLRVGAIELAERNSIPVTQALSEAGGFTPNAKRSKVHVLRPILTTNRLARFEINLTRIYEGKDVDFPLLPNDELLVDRSSSAKSVLLPVGIAMLGSIPFIIISVVLRP